MKEGKQVKGWGKVYLCRCDNKLLRGKEEEKISVATKVKYIGSTIGIIITAISGLMSNEGIRATITKCIGMCTRYHIERIAYEAYDEIMQEEESGKKPDERSEGEQISNQLYDVFKRDVKRWIQRGIRMRMREDEIREWEEEEINIEEGDVKEKVEKRDDVSTDKHYINDKWIWEKRKKV